MGNNTSLPSPELLHHEVQQFIECIGNVSLLDPDDGYDSPLARRFFSLATIEATGSRSEYLGLNVGVGLIAGILLTTCALLAGLTLAICGLDDTLLQLRAATGTPKERKHAAGVSKLKRHGTWMLCSLIICSCACGETFPFFIQILYRENSIFLAILTSTLCLAFFGEIIPQYIIPRNAIAWGYHCRPFVWFCMFLTSPVSWPIAWLLDTVFGKGEQNKSGIFSNTQLEALIRHHDETEKKGGHLGPNAARIAIGALKLDSQTIGAETMRAVSPDPENGDMDVEKAEVIVSHGMIVKWSAVKTIKIDDLVDLAFLRKVKEWSYSRVPVISKAEIGPWVGDEKNLQGGIEDWDGTRVYGFLHTRSLVGLQLKSGLRVKDLPLYPLPIVRESMSVYDLLNMFQMGAARMAIVIANPKYAPTQNASLIPSVFHDPEFSTLRWTATKRTNDNIAQKLINETPGNHDADKKSGSSEKGNGSEASVAQAIIHQNTYGIRSPRPVGILTFENIIDTIFQKTGHDEKDFFTPLARDDKPLNSIATPLSKPENVRTQNKPDPRDLTPLNKLPMISVPKARMSPMTPANGSLRFRTNSKNHQAAHSPGGFWPINSMDGAGDAREERAPSNSGTVARPSKRGVYSDSSYTENSEGGFHGSKRSYGSFINKKHTASDYVNEVAAASYDSRSSTPLQAKTASLPLRNTNPKEGPQTAKNVWRAVSASPALPALPSMKPVSAISQRMWSLDGAHDMDRSPSLAMPKPSTSQGLSSQISTRHSMMPAEAKPETRRWADMSGDTILSLDSWCNNYYDHDQFNRDSHYSALPVSIQRMQDERGEMSRISEEGSKRNSEALGNEFRPYEGFPPELLNRGDENRVPNYMSSTLPRQVQADVHRDFTPVREESFEDDRAMLPSQRKALQTTMGVDAARSSSLWF